MLTDELSFLCILFAHNLNTMQKATFSLFENLCLWLLIGSISDLKFLKNVLHCFPVFVNLPIKTWHLVRRNFFLDSPMDWSLLCECHQNSLHSQVFTPFCLQAMSHVSCVCSMVSKRSKLHTLVQSPATCAHSCHFYCGQKKPCAFFFCKNKKTTRVTAALYYSFYHSVHKTR